MSDISKSGNFPSTGFEAWKERVLIDLKGQDFDKKLRWKSPDGIITEPFYTEAPISGAQILPRNSAKWQIAESVLANEKGNQLALNALQGGATAVCFDMKNADVDPKMLTKDILLEIAPVFFRNSSLNAAMQAFLNEHSLDTIQLGLNPFLYQEEEKVSAQNTIGEALKYKKETGGNWGAFAVDGTVFKEKGGSIVQEIALILAQLQEYFQSIVEAGFKISDAGTFAIYLANGSNYFFEIAKIKALRSLIQTLFKANESELNAQIIAVSSNINKTKSDKHNNILRITTECMSAIIGGADVVVHKPFDLEQQEDDFVRRISRNIQHILAEEAYFDKNMDPAAGSYYIENITKEMMDASWQLFLEIEKKGGYLQALEAGFISQLISEHSAILQNNIATRKSILLGANQFPDKSIVSEKAVLEDSARLSVPFENLRLRIQNFEKVKGKRPLIYLLQMGTPVMRKARATYAYNFFGCAGYDIKESDASVDLKDNLEEINQLSPDFIVFCSDNESWSNWKDLKSKLPEASKKVLAGHPKLLPENLKEEDFDFVIYDGCNVLKVLESTFNALLIK